MKKIIILLILTLIVKIGYSQNNVECVRKHLDFLYCKSKQLCTNDESETYHKELLTNYFYIVNNYSKSILPDDYNQIGKEYFHLKDYDSAMYFYQLANSGNDTSAPCLNNIGTVLFMKGLYDSSFIYFNLAFQKDTLEQDYLNNLASYYGTKGDYQKCIELSLKSLKIDKNYNANLQALNSLVITYEALNNKAKLRKYKNDFKKLNKGKGVEAEALKNKTKLRMYKNDFEKLNKGKVVEAEEVDCECTRYKPTCEI